MKRVEGWSARMLGRSNLQLSNYSSGISSIANT